MPKKSQGNARELLERIGVAVREMGAQSVLASEVIADIFGLHKTDLESLDLIYLRGGACTAGELSRATGLTSGSVTALIDRLVKAGYVVREADPNDRRRQIVRIRPEAIAPIQAVYAPMQTEMFKLWSGYGERELEIVEDFIARSTQLHADYLERLRTKSAVSPPKRKTPAKSTRSRKTR
ncbi:MAG TPA: MarR family transcriptional regulator [Bryobacteraceae bacterium]|jgi:DNA-binding MarR family transcriptional regulator|nr:MarR family transcriptional regulator [Bryobacteraceae bacterium]